MIMDTVAEHLTGFETSERKTTKNAKLSLMSRNSSFEKSFDSTSTTTTTSSMVGFDESSLLSVGGGAGGSSATGAASLTVTTETSYASGGCLENTSLGYKTKDIEGDRSKAFSETMDKQEKQELLQLMRAHHSDEDVIGEVLVIASEPEDPIEPSEQFRLHSTPSLPRASSLGGGSSGGLDDRAQVFFNLNINSARLVPTGSDTLLRGKSCS